VSLAQPKSKPAVFAVIAAGTLLCAVLVFVGPPEDTLLWGALFDAGHPPTFGLFAFLILFLLSGLGRWRQGRTVGLYIVVFGVSLGLGVVSELLQALWSTDADPGDVLRDAIGITAFLLCYAAFDRQLCRNMEKQRTRRMGLLLLAGAIFFSAYIPILATFRAYVKREAAFPVIFDFNASWQQRFLTKDHCDVLTDSRRGLLIFRPGEYPGITIEEPYPNWNGWDRLTFQVSSSMPRPVSLVVRIDDAHHNNEDWDRFNRSFTIKPGDNAISIPIADVRAAPKTRKFDLAHVRRIFLFVPAPKESFALEVSEIRLTR